MRKLSIVAAAIALTFSTVGMAKQHNNVECPQKAEAMAANLSGQQVVRLADSLLSSPTPTSGSSRSGAVTR